MSIGLAQHFSYKNLIRFVLPSVIMMVFTSIYGVVDGLFISNFVGKTAFAAVNLIMPIIMALGAIGFMLGAGGTAIVSKTLGEGDSERANRYFSMLVYLAIFAGLVITVVGQLVLEPISIALGATGDMLKYCLLYGRVAMCGTVAFMLQNLFQNFLIAAERPKLGLLFIVAAGLTNIVLDALFVGLLRWGVVGAAVATLTRQVVGGILPVFYFVSKRNGSLLKLVFTKFNLKVIANACTNGSSELMTNLSMSIVNMVYNLQLMAFVGENGVAAFGSIMYLNFIFVSIFIGFSIGVAPIIGFNYGAQNKKELQSLFKKCLTVVGITGVFLTSLAIALSTPLASIFVGYDQELFQLTRHGLFLFVLSYVFAGFNIFGSAFFTALSNGVISALISFLRTLVFQLTAVLALPLLIGIDGIWLAIVVAEGCALVVTTVFWITKNKKYHYLKQKTKF